MTEFENRPIPSGLTLATPELLRLEAMVGLDLCFGIARIGDEYVALMSDDHPDEANVARVMTGEGLGDVTMRFELFCDLVEGVADAVDRERPTPRGSREPLMLLLNSASIDGVLDLGTTVRLVTEHFDSPGEFTDPEEASTVTEVLGPLIAGMWLNG